MDYKEKYEAALEQAREMLKSKRSVLIEKQALVKIFPELVESKDEEIRKSLLRMISDIDGGYPFENYGIIKKEAIAYLEKQKEQKPAGRVFTFDDVLALESAMALAKDDKELHGALKSIFERVHDAYHGEQKPEVDLEKLGEIARHLIAVKQHIEDMRLSEDEWSLIERIGYPERFNAKK